MDVAPSEPLGIKNNSSLCSGKILFKILSNLYYSVKKKRSCHRKSWSSWVNSYLLLCLPYMSSRKNAAN